MDREALGLVHIYCGDGKGKTTAAVGLAVRALGCGHKVAVVQFLKDGTSPEMGVLSALGAKVLAVPGPVKFTFSMNEADKAQIRDCHHQNLRRAMDLCQKENCGLLILDEALGAVGEALLDEDLLADFIKNRPPHTELVLTGRGPSARLIQLADYVSEVKKIAHPYDRGFNARNGIE